MSADKPPRHTPLMDCPRCKGKGHATSRPFHESRCSTCFGTGVVFDERARWVEAGMKKRSQREARGETIRDYARRVGLTAQRVSDMEIGIANPEGLR